MILAGSEEEIRPRWRLTTLYQCSIRSDEREGNDFYSLSGLCLPFRFIHECAEESMGEIVFTDFGARGRERMRKERAREKGQSQLYKGRLEASIEAYHKKRH